MIERYKKRLSISCSKEFDLSVEQLWDLISGQTRIVGEEHPHLVYSIAFHPAGGELISASPAWGKETKLVKTALEQTSATVARPSSWGAVKARRP